MLTALLSQQSKSKNKESILKLDQVNSIQDIINHIANSKVITVGKDIQNLVLPTEGFERPSPKRFHPTMKIINPKTIAEAFRGENAVYWYWAIADELENLRIRKTWKSISKVTVKNKNLRPIKSKFSFRLTIKFDGTLKFRARLVACGYSQIPGIDFDETFAPTAKYKSLCIILHLAAVFDWEIAGIDVANAFIEADIDKEIYMYLPKELFCDEDEERIAVQLQKSLYGLKQAGELWYQLLNSNFIALGFYRLAHDQCIYIQRDKYSETVTIIVVYVDDILFIGNDRPKIDYIINHLIEQFTKLTDLGTINRYIGIDLKRDFINHTIHLSQQPYTSKYVSDHVSESSKIKLNP
jgi:hypothetical protein